MRHFLFVIFVLLFFINFGCDEESPINADIQPGNDLIFTDSGPSGVKVFLDSNTTDHFALARISGIGSLPPAFGIDGAIQNTRVALYTSINNWNFDITFAITACDGNGNYTMSGIPPGVYYMDAWKDTNNNQVWGDSGDYIWIYGSGVYPNYTLEPIQFSSGTTTVNFELFVVP